MQYERMPVHNGVLSNLFFGNKLKTAPANCILDGATVVRRFSIAKGNAMFRASHGLPPSSIRQPVAGRDAEKNAAPQGISLRRLS
jgi:hypothetical protein